MNLMGFSETIPILGVPFVIFPGEQVALHLSDPQHLSLISGCLGAGEGQASFGISHIRNGHIEQIGCSAIVERVLDRYEDGALDVKIRGQIRYVLTALERSGNYPVGRVDYFEDLELKPDHSLRSKAVSLHIKLVELASGHTHTPFFAENDRASFALGHSAGFDLAERQRFLEMRSEAERLRYLIAHYREAIPKVQEQHELRERVVINGDVRKVKSEEF